MRFLQLVIVSCFTAALGFASGCGGNVVVDTGSGGAGSTAGNGASNTGSSANVGTTSGGQTGTTTGGTTGTFMTSGGNAVAASVGSGTGTCSDESCYVGSDGSCGCEVTCNGQTYGSRCQPTPNGAICECSINGMAVGKCDGAVAVCDVFMSCCGQVFGGG